MTKNHGYLAVHDDKILSNTRGVSLASLVEIVSLIEKQSPQNNEDIIRTAQALGIKEFVRSGPSKDRTRIRHFWYALECLGLATRSINGTLELTDFGHAVGKAKSARESIGIADKDVFVLLRDSVLESKYVNRVWLTYLGEDRQDFFTLLKVKLEHQCRQLRFPEDRHADLSSKDSGYRLIPSDKADWERNCIFEDIQHGTFTGMVLSDTARRELVTGVHKWCLELQIVGEVPSELSIGKNCTSLAMEIYPIRSLQKPLHSLLDPTIDLIVKTIQQSSSGSRLRIPSLLRTLCIQYGLAVNDAKTLLQLVHETASDRLYFEGASRDVLVTAEVKMRQPLDYFLRIGGVWRASILLL